MLEITLYQADAFSRAAFGGNPAAVCLIPASKKAALTDDVCQKIAAEMNLSETAFVYSPTDSFVDESVFQLRWFTPTKEVDLCGHATLATAATLSLKAGCQAEVMSFNTLSGELRVKRVGSDTFQMDLPMNAPQALEKDSELYGRHKDLIQHVAGDKHVVALAHSKRTRKLIVHLDITRDELEGLRFEADTLMALHTTDDTRGVIVTTNKGLDGAHGSDEDDYHFVSRYFAPWNGIPEDPVTGSAHTVLFPYWRQRFRTTDKPSQPQDEVYRARQCSQRGGDLTLEAGHDADGEERLLITANAFIVLEGRLFV